MIQADGVNNTPPLNTSSDSPSERPAESVRALESGLAIQQRERETALLNLARLRKEAMAEIERLIAFLDQSDEYVMTEREPDGIEDEQDDEPEDGDPPEDDGLREPALGSLDGHDNQTVWAIGDRRDIELDPAESGIGDYDGLAEQVGSQDWQHAGMA